MNELGDWMQSNWYQLGTLLLQCAFLTAAVWFARKILKTMRASQAQAGALLKLSLSDGSNERSRSANAPHQSTPYVMAEWPAAEAPAVTLLQAERRSGFWRRIILWLQAPMGSQNRELAPWRKVILWLQAPAGS